MTNMLAFVATAGLVAPALCQTAPNPPESLLHLSTSFELVVHAPYRAVAPLFGAHGERVWAGEDWDPKFIYPQPAGDMEGAVFIVRDGPLKKIWVTALFDLEARHIRHVYFVPELLVTIIDIRFKIIDQTTTQVKVVYTRTAIAPEGNEHVKRMSEQDKTAGGEWQQQIDSYLASQKPSQKH
jgi:hypothetical protein